MVFAVAVFGVGCGSDKPEPEAGRPGQVKVQADQEQDRQIGYDLRRYLVRNCPAPGSKLKVPKRFQGTDLFPRVKQMMRGGVALCDSIATIEVKDSRVTARIGLDDDAEVHAAGLAFCNLIQGSDVADFTPGHELQDQAGETIKVCRARSLP